MGRILEKAEVSPEYNRGFASRSATHSDTRATEPATTKSVSVSGGSGGGGVDDQPRDERGRWTTG